VASSRGCLKTIAVSLITILLLSGLGAGLVYYRYLGSYRNFEGNRFVEIDRGMSSRDIAELLANQGVVQAPWVFLAVRAIHPRATLQAGEYKFDEAATPFTVFDRIRRGDIFFEEFTVPEGSNIFDIAAILQRSDTVKPDNFLKAAADPATIRDLDPAAPNLEGYLFPSTYRVTHRTTAKQLCRLMTSEFRKEWTELSGHNPGIDVHRVVTLASLVEKESANPTERPLVAAVFSNRLRERMPLQCDPTTVYAALIENRYRGVIHKSDLASTNAYNTYSHSGLPPGPIANPGTSSLKAALHPASTEYLYFVAKPDGSGSHHFSATLAEHDQAVSEYRSRAH